MKIEIEVNDRMWRLALEWRQIEKNNPLPPSQISPPSADKEWLKAFEKQGELWKCFLKAHKLIHKEKPTRFLGIKIANWSFPQKEEFDKASWLIKWTEERK